MLERCENIDKRNVAINACLDQFVSKGLFGTTSRDLSKALNLQSAGMYSYFENKDDAVIACAEQAAIKLERDLFKVAINCLEKKDVTLEPVKSTAKNLSPMMRFFTQVCATDKYEVEMRRVLCRLNESHKSYVSQIAVILSVDQDTVKSLVHMGITATVNYMVFQEDIFINSLFRLIEKELQRIK